MHLVDELVLGVSQSLHVVVDVGPRPGAGPLVAFDKDVLSGTGSADTVDGGLVEVKNEGLVHGVVLVVGIEHDAAVALEQSSKVLPPGLEVRGGGDDLVKEAAIVVGVKKNSRSLASDVVDNGGEVLDVSLVVGASQAAGVSTLHLELHTEGVVALRNEGLQYVRKCHGDVESCTYVDSSRVGEDKVLAPSTGKVLLSELTTSLVDTSPEELSIARCSSGSRATASGSLEGSRGRLSSTGLALTVPLVDNGALVARDAGCGTREAFTTALSPG